MKALILIALCLTSLNLFAASTHDGYIIKNGAIATDTVSVTSSFISLDNNRKVSLHSRLATGSTASGTVDTYLSNDMVGDARFVTNWVSYNSTSLASVAAPILSNFTDIGAKWLKVVFAKTTSATSTGTISTIIYVQ